MRGLLVGGRLYEGVGEEDLRWGVGIVCGKVLYLGRCGWTGRVQSTRARCRDSTDTFCQVFA